MVRGSSKQDGNGRVVDANDATSMTSTSGKGTVELNNKVNSEATGEHLPAEQEVGASVVGEDKCLTCIKVAVNHRGVSQVHTTALTKLTTPPVLVVKSPTFRL